MVFYSKIISQLFTVYSRFFYALINSLPEGMCNLRDCDIIMMLCDNLCLARSSCSQASHKPKKSLMEAIP